MIKQSSTSKLYSILTVVLVLCLTVTGCVPALGAAAHAAPPSPVAERTPTPSPTRARDADAVRDHERGVSSARSTPMATPASQLALDDVEPPATYDEALGRLDEFMVLIEELRGEIDRTQFDLEALEFELGFDAEDIIAFVRDEVSFEQYPGLLRGTQGTLMSRAGNALDQATLLTTMLKDAGYEARVVEGTLTRRQARGLLQQMAVEREPAPPVGDMDRIREILIELGGMAGMSEERGEAQIDALLNPPGSDSVELFEAIEADASLILDRLDEAEIELGSPTAKSALINEARDYFWVEYRLGPSDDWESAHPAFAAPSVVPPDLEPERILKESIPQELQHRFRFQVFLEQKMADELVVKPLMDPWERPVANLVGVPLVYTNHPGGMTDLDDLLDLDAMLEETRFFTPVFNNRVAKGAEFFDLNGNLVPQAEAESAAAGVFQETHDAFEGAIGALTEAENPDDVVTVTAQWIEYTLIAPGGQEQLHRRVVFDRVGVANREAGTAEIADNTSRADLAKMLMETHSFMLAPGSYPQAYVLDRLLGRVLDARDNISRVYEAIYNRGELASLLTKEEVGEDVFPLAHLILYSMFDAGAPQGEGTLSYRAEPSLLLYKQGVVPLSEGLESRVAVDIVNSTRRVFAITEQGLVVSPEAALFAGVWETHAEQLYLESEPEGVALTPGVAHVLEEAEAQSIPIRLISPEQSSTLARLAIGQEAKANLQRDLDAGFAVLVPSRAPRGDEGMMAWWRIDLETGQALGITSDGRGGSPIVEYLVQWRNSFLVASGACLLVYVAVRSAIAAHESGNVAVSDAIKPGDFLNCAAFGISVATFRTNLRTPTAGYNPQLGRYVHRAVNKTDISALTIGVGFVIGLVNALLVPDDW